MPPNAFFPPGKEALRALTLRLLPEWIQALHDDTLPIHIPKQRGIMTLHPDKTFHFHPELFLQLSGETTFTFPEEQLHVGPRSLCLVPRGLPHREKVRPKDGPFSNLVFMYGAPHEFFFHIAYERQPGLPAGKHGIACQGQFKTMISLLDEAAAQASHNAPYSLHAIRGLIVAHLAMLHHALQGEHGPQEPFKVIQARQAILRHLSNPRLTPSTLARQLQCNPDYLTQLFRKSLGLSLHSFIQQQRLQRASDLLAHSTLNIAQVSEATGFTDPSYFTRAFKKWTGATPRQHRQALRISDINIDS